MIENNQVTLIDVRTQNEYELMHIKSAINIPVADIEKKIFIYEQNSPLMLYCSSGVRSKKAIEILNSLGYGNIYIWEYGALATFPYKNMLEYNSNKI
jgi:rhodanese-related sulfurtransferase